MGFPSKSLDEKLDEKRVYRQQLRKLLRDFSCEMPIIGTSPTDDMDFSFFRELLQGTASLKIPFVIFQNEKECNELPFDLYDFVNVVLVDSKKNNAFSGCDSVICFSEKSVNQCFTSGIVPIASDFIPGVVNYNPNSETGNSFVFEKKDNTINPWQIFAATIRAIETYRFPFDWKWIIRNGRKF